MINTPSLYSAIYEPKTLKSSKGAVSIDNTQNKSQIVYYKNEEKEKNRKKSKVAMAILLIASVTGTIGAGIFAKKGNIASLIENAKTAGESIKNLNLTSKCANIMSNTINIKDDIVKKGTDTLGKIPVLSWIDKACRGITESYHYMMRNCARPQYEKLREKVICAGGEALNIPKFDDIYDNLVKSIGDTVSKKGNRVSDGLFKGNIVEKMTLNNIADTKILKLGSVQDALTKVSLDNIENPSEELIKAVGEFNNMKISLMGNLIPKLRDVCVGSAPTDIAKILISIAALGIAVGAEDDKKEKTSIEVNLGIPLVTTLCMTVFNTARLISGAKAVILGLFTGQVAGYIAKGLVYLRERHLDKIRMDKD